MTDSNLRLTASPHVRSEESTVRIMWSVVWSLVPVIAALLGGWLIIRSQFDQGPVIELELSR